MDRKKWVLVIAMMFLIMSSMYVGAFIVKHRSSRGQPVYIDTYRGTHHRVVKLYPQRERIRIWPIVDMDYTVKK
jgi:hypothetical protein